MTKMQRKQIREKIIEAIKNMTEVRLFEEALQRHEDPTNAACRI
jgi:hypothetical protein